jgi:hypothetical protein
MDLKRINSSIRDIPDLPKPGVLFKAIFPLQPISGDSTQACFLPHVWSLHSQVGWSNNSIAYF